MKISRGRGGRYFGHIKRTETPATQLLSVKECSPNTTAYTGVLVVCVCFLKQITFEEYFNSNQMLKDQKIHQNIFQNILASSKEHCILMTV